MAVHIGSVLRLPRNLHCREYLRADPPETRGEVMDRTATRPVCLHFGLWCPFQLPVPLMENVDHKTLSPNNLTGMILKSPEILYMKTLLKHEYWTNSSCYF